jgi:hypothetical protein
MVSSVAFSMDRGTITQPGAAGNFTPIGVLAQRKGLGETKETKMNLRLLLPAAAALAMAAASPASAQWIEPVAPVMGEGVVVAQGMGPYAYGCESFRESHARDRCEQIQNYGWGGYAPAYRPYMGYDYYGG